jgi:membrane-bound lytic murein transglycosylase D
MNIRFYRDYIYSYIQTLGLLFILIFATSPAEAAQRTVCPKKHQVNLDDAVNWADALNANSDLNVNVDGSVVRWLNHYLCSKLGRQTISATLKRKSKVDRIIFEKLDRLGLPRELIAIPFIESGFSNEKTRKNINSPLGIWQFEAKTARKLSLLVNSRVDERKQVPRSTDAALRLIKHLFETFDDWQLVIAAYNQGEGHVTRAINRSKDRDAISLANSGHLNQYVAKTTAIMLALHQLEAI